MLNRATVRLKMQMLKVTKLPFPGSPNRQGEEGPEQGPHHADAPAGLQLGLPGRRIRIHLSRNRIKPNRIKQD